ncbi:MAG: hypothetical protein LUD72_06790, partial [Bacteroidales bacterium]|nr:hypothetical protein [Bacteroidales bacterium]
FLAITQFYVATADIMRPRNLALKKYRASKKSILQMLRKKHTFLPTTSSLYLQPVVPKYYTMPNSKLADNIGVLINEGETGIRVSGKGRRELITPANVTMINTDGVEISGNYTEFDAQVQDAICSLYLYGNNDHIFTPELVVRTIRQDKKKNLTKQEVKRVTESIEKQRIIHADCDITSIVNQRGYNTDKTTLGDFLLDLRDTTVEAGGKKVKAYYLKEMPFLLEYSMRIGNQIITVPAHLLDIRPTENGKLLDGNISTNPERIAIRGYLIRRIAIMKHDNAQAADALRKYNYRRKKDKDLPPRDLNSFEKESNRILYDSVFKAAGVANKSAQTLFNYKEYIKLCLDNWTIKKYIAGYEIINGRRKDSEIAADILLE